VFNVVHAQGGGDAIFAAPGIKAVSFVGSTPSPGTYTKTGTKSGKRVQALAAPRKWWLLPDADLD